LRGLIEQSAGGEVTFLVPERLRNLRELFTRPPKGPPASGNDVMAAAGATPTAI
jgi:hypothetical protein